MLSFIDLVKVFYEQLNKKIGDVFRFEDLGTRLTMEIIIKAALDLDLDY